MLGAIVHRDLLRFTRNRTYAILMLLQPLLYLLMLGTGMAGIVSATATGGDYRTYLFPGILMMTVQTPAVAAAINLVTDRHSGVLRQALIAPVSRATLLSGQCLGGAAVAMCQGALLLVVAPLAGVPYHPMLVVVLLTEMAVAAFALTAAALAMAMRIRSQQTFQVLLSVITMPLLFTSGALFPLSALPDWLAPVSLANPLTYVVDPLRQALEGHVRGYHAPPGPQWLGAPLPAAFEVSVLLVLGAVSLTWAARRFRRPE